MIKLDVTLLIQFFNFVVLMVILNYLLYRPLRKVIQRRQENIQDSHQTAQQLEGQIEEKMTRYQEQLQAAKRKGAEERSLMRKSASEEEAKILAAAQAGAAEKLQQIKQQVQADTAEARAKLTKETGDLARQISSKVLGRALS